MTVTELHPAGYEYEPHERPGPSRWRPTRAGIVNVWRYYEETFDLHEGRLLLRGPNGTGKSKALELLLPYLLDANLRPSRLSTFGGSERTMYWNLMGDGYPNTSRVGYVWLEFGRAAEGGEGEWFTCGARLQASTNSRQVQSTYFTTTLRVGVSGGLSLTTPDGRPLTKGDLAAAVEGVGQTFESATADYRRAVRHTLFPEFNDDQYEALITALLQLRTPKLSEHLNPDTLSELLSQALPPLDQADVAEIAEGFEKLDRRREELSRLGQEVEAAESLATRARNYARRVLRAAAAAVISATSAMTTATRRAREREEEHEGAKQQLRTLESTQAELEDEEHRIRQEVSGLESRDSYVQGQELDRLRQAAERAEEQARKAHADAVARATDASRDEESAQALRQSAWQAEHVASRAGDEARQSSQRAGMTSSYEEVAADGDVTRARRLLRAAVETREEQIEQVRRAVDEHRGAVDERTRAEARLEQRREQRGQAEDRLGELQRQREDALVRLRADLDRWARECRELPLAAYAETLAEVAEDEAAVARIVGDAASRAGEWITRAEAALEARRQECVEERDRYDGERIALQQATVLVPDPPHSRSADRDAMPGAPLWRLVDWRPGVGEESQAHVEAALEASGLLDAWVLPSGELRVDGHDAFAETALASPAPGESLGDVLTVESELPVPARRVADLLAGVAYGASAPDHPAAVGADGSWRLGVAHGSWDKADAAFIGATAQERARARRIAELTRLIDDLDARLGEIDRQQAELAARRERVAAERERCPAHRELRDLTTAVGHAEADVAARRDAEAQAEAERTQADTRVTAALRALSLAAGDHGLPTTAEGLDAVAESLRTYRSLAEAWLDRLQQARSAASSAKTGEDQARRSRGLAEAAQEHADELGRAAEGERAKYEAVERTVGADYREVVEQLTGLRGRLREIDTERRTLRGRENELREQAARLAEALRQAKEEGEKAVGERDHAAARFGHLAGTSLLDDARLAAELPAMTGTTVTLEAARTLADELSSVPHEPRNIKDAENNLSQARYATQQVLAGRADLTLEPDDDVVTLVAVVDGTPMGAARLHRWLRDDLARTRQRLTDDEQALFDRTLTGDTRRQVADRIRLAEDLKESMNSQLQRVRTVSNLRVKLDWRVDPELTAGMREARNLLLRDPASLSDADREALHEFFRARIEEVRAADTAAGWEQQLLQVLDYRRWHQFVVLMDKGDEQGWVPVTRRRHGALSGGEKAIALHLPLFAAAAAHYRAAPKAPRLILLDEVFVGVDEVNRGQLLDLLVGFDLDMVLTSDHEWCTYRELDGIAIHQLIAGEDDDAVTTVRFVWDGERVREADPQPEPVTAGVGSGAAESTEPSLFDG